MVLIDQPNRKRRFDAAEGDAEALADLVRAHGRGVRAVLAGYVDSWAAVEQLEVTVWGGVRTELATSPNITAALQACAHATAVSYLEGADRQAIQERDVLRHLVLQIALEEVRGQRSEAAPGPQINERLKVLPTEQRTLLELYYARSVALQDLALQRNGAVADVANDLCIARAACDWRTSVQTSAGDRLIPSLTEELLSNTIDPDSRALLATSVAQDLNRSIRLERQVRLHLLLRALIGPFSLPQVQHIVAAALGQVEMVPSPATAEAGSGRTRVRQSEVLRATSNRRPVQHPSRRKNSSTLIAVVFGAAVLVVGAVLLPGRNAAPEKPVISPSTGQMPVVMERVTTIPSTPKPPATTPSTSTPVTSKTRAEPVGQPLKPAPSSPAVNTTAALAYETVTLINADTDQPIPGYEILPADATILLSQLPTKNINFDFRAPPEIKSVRWILPGCSLKEDGFQGTRPFSLGDAGGDFNAWTPTPGLYTLTVFACSDGEGNQVVRTTTWHIRFK